MHQLCYGARELTPRNARTGFISRAGTEIRVMSAKNARARFRARLINPVLAIVRVRSRAP